MRLFDRISTLVKADAHGVLESLEERTLLLKQYLREAELAFDQQRARLDALRDDEERLRDAIAQREDELKSLDEDVALALGGGKEDLARFALRRLIPRRKEVAGLRAQLAERSTDVARLAERSEQHERQLDALRTRVSTAVLRQDAAAPPSAWRVDPPVADEEVELELMRRRTAAEGGVR